MGVTANGAAPVFVEPDKYLNIDPDKIEEAITEKTKAVLAVHLYGQACDMSGIVQVCKDHNLRLVEDCAQSHGAGFGGQKTGTFGDFGCFSFYPSKNLGAFGDGGGIWCRTPKLAEQVRMLRNYGSEKRYYNKTVGYNSRLDEIQAALLSVKLKHLDELNAERQNIAGRYDCLITNPMFAKPQKRRNADHIYHQYILESPDAETRERLIAFLKDRGIGSLIHYPVPPHLAECYEYLGYKRGSFPITEEIANTVVSIPIFNGMTEEQIEAVAGAINEFK
jgi:dTDP-4-amino-4,6-dideoxygalactose transaminase